MSNLMLFRTVVLEQFRECPEGTHFLTYKMIKNIKLPVTFSREIFCFSFTCHFFEIDKMKCFWTCSRNPGRNGGISLLGNEDEPIFRRYVLPNQPKFLVILYS